MERYNLGDGFNKYQDLSYGTKQHDYGMPEDVYFALGMAGEVGEVAEKIKKKYRDGTDPNATTEWVVNLAKELGDVLWYLSAVAKFNGIDLDVVAKLNRDKLIDRTNRGVRGGSGDNR